MGKFYKSFNYLLGLLCAAAFAFPALAADKLNLPVDRHGFFKVAGDTYKHPTTAKIREAIAAANPHVEKLPGGGLSQSLPANIEITATKQTSPISAKVKVGAQALKNGAVRCLKSLKCNIGVQFAAAGLDALFDSVDWAMGEGGQVTKHQAVTVPAPPAGTYSQSGVFRSPGQSIGSLCDNRGGCFSTNSAQGGTFYCGRHAEGNAFDVFAGYSMSGATHTCYYKPGGNLDDAFTSSPVPESEIEDAVQNNYVPEPSDFSIIARYVDMSDPDVFAEISNIPSLLMPPTTKTIYDADGNAVEVQETNIWYDFDVTDNNTKQPAIDIKENKEVKTYDANGRLTGKETTTSTSKAAASASASASSDFDIPTDCEFMPTVCRFLAWFQEPDPELSNEPDLKALKHDLEPERNYQVGTTTANCPAPIQINLAMFPSVEISLQPLCDFVDLLRPLLLAFAFYFAGRIVLRT